MKRLLIIAGFTVFGSMAIGAIYVLAGCGDTWQSDGADTVSNPTPSYQQTVPVSITKHWRIFWTDGYERRDALASGSGQNYGWYTYTRYCPPQFDTPYWETNTSGTGDWVQRAHNKVVNVATDSCATPNTNDYTDSYHRHNCPTPGGCNGVADWGQYPTTGCASGFVYSGGVCTRSAAFMNHCNQYGGYDFEACGCVGGCEFATNCSPVVIDVISNGFSLTDALNGVNFDVDGDGVAERRAWTDGSSDDSWLALDRNGNGIIDGGRELFGSATSQPPPPTGIELNGFNALNEYDEAGFGGNGDGVIDNRDAIFSSLRLWQDTNHNGISEANELYTLASKGIARIDTDYKKSRRIDQFGNEFRYRAKVRDSQGAQIGRWAWDVFLVTSP